MLKRKLTLCLLLSCAPCLINASDEEYYEGTWEQSPEDARTSLAQNIFVSIDSEIQREVETKILEEAIRDKELYKEHMHQETTLDLSGVEIEEDPERGYRARISREDFDHQARRSAEVFSDICRPKNAPNTWKARQDFVKDCHRDANAVLAMASVAGLSSYVSDIQQYHADFKDMKKEGRLLIYTTPSTGFSVNNREFEPGKGHGQGIQLPEGDYKIIWDDDDYCKVEEEIEIEAGKTTKISKDLENKPSITVSSRTPNARLIVDGSSKELGKSHRQDSCSGEVSYKVFNDYTSREKIVTLKPGLEYRNTVNILTEDTAQRLEGLSTSYRSDTRYRLLAGYSNVDELEKAYRMRLEKSNGRGAIRYGYGFSYGWDNATEVDVYVQTALQLARLGGKPLHLTPQFGFIPYAGIELGLAYHEREDSDGNEVDDYGTDFQDDHVMFRYIAGIDFPIDEYLGISMQIAKATTMEESWEGSLGLTITFK